MEVTDKTNCVVDFIDESLKHAEELRSVPEGERGPLHGIPISVKECLFVKGYDATLGMAKKIGQPSKEDSELIRVMKQLGAVPFCLTNIPQTMLSFTCSNPVYGRTAHPKVFERTPGGSSGGEACLIASGGSILGLGTDGAGSMRIPAHFCGLVTLKPSTGRLCDRSFLKRGIVGVGSNAGFMCRTVDGLVLGMRALLENVDKMADIDHSVVPLAWRQQQFDPERKLRIGWYDDDQFIPPVPGCKRAVRVAIEALKAQGHEVVPFYPPHLKDFIKDYFSFATGDMGKLSLKEWEGEELDQAIEANQLVFKIPFRRSLLPALLKPFSPRMSEVMKCAYDKTVDLWLGIEDTEKRKAAVLKAWSNLGLDVVIAPGFPQPAPPTEDPGRLTLLTCYTNVYNVMQLPVGTVPVDTYTNQDRVSLRR